MAWRTPRAPTSAASSTRLLAALGEDAGVEGDGVLAAEAADADVAPREGLRQRLAAGEEQAGVGHGAESAGEREDLAEHVRLEEGLGL